MLRVPFPTCVALSLFSLSASADVVRIDEVGSVQVSVTPETKSCVWSTDHDQRVPCDYKPGRRSVARVIEKFEKTGSATLVLSDGKIIPLGSSSVAKAGPFEDIDYRAPLSNLLSELDNLRQNVNGIYFNQYNLCYRVGVVTDGLNKDRRAGGDLYHLKTDRIYVDCDAHAVPPMVFVKE